MKRSEGTSFYKTYTWQQKSLDIRERDNFECQRCKSLGGYSRAECVHHIKHLKDRPDLALVDDNLISLCYACHNIMHPEKTTQAKIKFENEERW